MPFELLDDGFIRRFTPLAPRDWMSFVEGVGGTPTALPLYVFLGDGAIANRLQGGTGMVTNGMAAEIGVDKALNPLDPVIHPDFRGFALDLQADPPTFPKFFALFVEGLDPTDDPGNPHWGFSTDFGPSDGGTFEVAYGQPLPWPWLGAGVARLGEKALIRRLVGFVVDRLDATFRKWYGRDAAGLCRDGEVRGAVDTSRIFVVGQGAAATLALDLLNEEPTGAFEFAGAALVVGGGGGTIGGRVIADPEGLAAGDPFAGDFPVGIVHTPRPSDPAKAVIVLCDSTAAHLGSQTDTVAAQALYPPGPPESSPSRALLE
jgi:hypothetical protein